MNKIELSQIFSSLEAPIEQAFGEHIFFACDEKGKILKVFDEKEVWHGGMNVRPMIEYLKKNETVFNAFRLEPLLDLKSLPAISKTFAIRENLSFYGYIGDFHTDLPLTFLKLYRAGERFLGVVRDTGIIPNIHSASSNQVIYVDEQGLLRGFNENFRLLFHAEGIAPAAMAGRPLKDFITPTPDEIRADYLERVAEADPEWEPVPGLSGLSPALFRPHENAKPDFREGALYWENPEPEAQFLILGEGTLPMEKDYRLTLDCETITGDIPCLVFGNGLAKGSDPIYLAGADPAGKGYFIKKGGFFLARSPGSKSDRSALLWLEKRGKAVLYGINNDLITACHDPVFPDTPAAFFSLGLRPGSRVRIRGFRIDRCPPFPQGESETIVRVKSRPARYFSLAKVENIGLTTRFPEIAAHILTDVTAIQSKVAQYRRQYREEKEKSDALAVKLSEVLEQDADFIGESRVVRAIKETAATIASSEATVLIQGPTGTGKEVLAGYIHRKSPRRYQPFIKVDCSLLPETLIESELFGHEKGAFTGAVARKIGRLEQADGGTLFLDEIGNITLPVQAKLLGFLQDRKITRVGGERAVQLDVRILAASNIPLPDLIRQGRMREDLYYRLNMVSIDLPPLKDRPEDIPLLCRKFLTDFNRAHGKAVSGLSQEAQNRLMRYPWPGNVRELENVVRRAHLFCTEHEIGAEQILLGPVKNASPAGAKATYHLKGMNREKLLDIVKRCDGVVSAAARELGVTRKACYSNLRKYGIDPETFRAEASGSGPGNASA